jgi:hypothetical protein
VTVAEGRGELVMTNVSHTSDLTSARRTLLRILQRVNFGRVEQLHVRDGQPVFMPAPAVIREIKFGGGENGPRPESDTADFRLKTQVVELFALFDRIGTGVITVLEVRHGLPFRVLVTEAVA